MVMRYAKNRKSPVPKLTRGLLVRVSVGGMLPDAEDGMPLAVRLRS